MYSGFIHRKMLNIEDLKVSFHRKVKSRCQQTLINNYQPKHQLYDSLYYAVNSLKDHDQPTKLYISVLFLAHLS